MATRLAVYGIYFLFLLTSCPQVIASRSEYNTSVVAQGSIKKTKVPRAKARQAPPKSMVLIGETPQSILRKGRVALEPINISPEVWYEIDLSYRCSSPKELLTKSLALVEIKFLRAGKLLRNTGKIEGLNSSPTGMDYIYIPSPEFLPSAESDKHLSRMRFSLRSPRGAEKMQIALVGWRNRGKIEINNLRVTQNPFKAPTKVTKVHATPYYEQKRELSLGESHLKLTSEPIWAQLEVTSGFTYRLNGNLIIPKLVARKPRALARIEFINEQGLLLSPQAGTISMSEKIGPYIYLKIYEPTGEWKLIIKDFPAETKQIRLGIQTWYGPSLQLHPIIEVEEKLLSAQESIERAGLLTSFRDEQSLGLSSPESALRWLGKLYSRKMLRKGTADIALKDVINEWPIHNPGTVFPFSSPGLEYLKVRTEEKLAALRTNQIIIGNYPKFSLPENQEWNEDPFNSISWRQNYHALSWINGLSRIHSQDKMLAIVFDTLKSWHKSNNFIRNADPYAWDDHGTAKRTEVLLYFLKKHSDLDATHPELALLIRGLTIFNALVLDDLLDNNSFSAHNHRLFHAYALYKVAAQYPNWPFSPYWKRRATSKLIESTLTLFDEDGFSIEQSANYHLMVLEVLATFYKHLASAPNTSDVLLSPISKTIQKAVFAAYGLFHPNGKLVRLGDTLDLQDMDMDAYFARLRSKLAIRDEHSEPSRKELTTQTRNFLYPKSGYFRMTAATNKIPDHQQNSIFVDLSSQIYSHGHYDATSFEYVFSGVRWMIDSGGPFKYGSSIERRHLMSSRAHNVCMANNEEQIQGETWVVSHDKFAGYTSLVLQTNTDGAGYCHYRQFLLPNALDGFIVTDYFQGPKLREIQCRFQFDPQFNVELKSGQAAIEDSSGKRIDVSFVSSSGNLSTNLKTGSGSNVTLEGWVNRYPLRFEKAPALVYGTSHSGNIELSALVSTSKRSRSEIDELMKKMPPLSEKIRGQLPGYSCSP